MTRWTLGWLLWFLWFAVEEGRALHHGGWEATLSGHVWRAFAIKDAYGCDVKGRTRFWRLRRLALITIMGWMALHFLTGGAY